MFRGWVKVKNGDVAEWISLLSRAKGDEPPCSWVKAGRSGFRRILVVRARPGGPLKAPDV